MRSFAMKLEFKTLVLSYSLIKSVSYVRSTNPI
jgi:hypothetical protein